MPFQPIQKTHQTGQEETVPKISISPTKNSNSNPSQVVTHPPLVVTTVKAKGKYIYFIFKYY